MAWDDTVFAMCNGEPYKQWGVGPEGEEQAIANCNYDYSGTTCPMCQSIAGGPPCCMSYFGSVEAMCEGEPFAAWGIGSEGKTQAITNCNNDYLDGGKSGTTCPTTTPTNAPSTVRVPERRRMQQGVLNARAHWRLLINSTPRFHPLVVPRTCDVPRRTLRLRQ